MRFNQLAYYQLRIVNFKQISKGVTLQFMGRQSETLEDQGRLTAKQQ
jgi:hypothetical protein